MMCDYWYLRILSFRAMSYANYIHIHVTPFYAYVLYRIFKYDYLGIMYFIGLYIIYLIVQYFTPSGLPDPDED